MSDNKSWLDEYKIPESCLEAIRLNEGLRDLELFKLGVTFGAKVALEQAQKIVSNPNKRKVTIQEEDPQDIKVGLTA
tara:strand:- start:3961 stop:4191 length:231 start_codon:yes stop_codon:yes gene_type:complete